jgi:hypothetical protein
MERLAGRWAVIGPLQPQREFDARKSKKIKAKLLGFACISLAETGLFKELRGKK